MVELNTTISIINLNVNDLNTPVTSQRLKEWIKKQYLSILYLQEAHSKYKDIDRLEVNGWSNYNMQAANIRRLYRD